MRVLIIGCGYVGTTLAAELVAKGHEVYGLRRSPGTIGKITTAGSGSLAAQAVSPLLGEKERVRASFTPNAITPIQADITEPETLEALPPNWDWIVNCVSSGGGGVEEYRKVYVEGTRNVLKWLADSPPQKFVYTSSTSVYGQDEGKVVTEDSPTEPRMATGKLLVETEGLLLSAVRETGFPAVILRLSGIYGPGRGYWFKQFVKGEARIEDGNRILNMVHRDDAAGAIIAALEPGKSGRIYNVADDEPVTLVEFYGWLAEQLGNPSEQTASPSLGERPAPPPPTLGSRRGSTNKRISNARLKSELGYRFKYPTFREGYAMELEQIRKSAEK